jgi:hypothetical protein
MDEPRRGVVLNDIIAGSTPKTTYYILLAISALIAGFGLLTNSPAVVIGAMLVSPLMTPIFGISLGLVQGNVSLLREGLIAEIGGVVLAIAAAAILGFFPFAHASRNGWLSGHDRRADQPGAAWDRYGHVADPPVSCLRAMPSLWCL